MNFAGPTIYRGGLMFALIAQEQLYFKASDFLAEEFIALGLPPFVYASKGRSTAHRDFKRSLQYRFRERTSFSHTLQRYLMLETMLMTETI
jgi:TfoX/Sxy family transcriptional regulator of competence genes